MNYTLKILQKNGFQGKNKCKAKKGDTLVRPFGDR
jgi:hypothetical protein